VRTLALLVTVATVTAGAMVVAGLSLAFVSNSHDGVATQGECASLTFCADDVGDSIDVSDIDDSLELAIFLGFLLPLLSRILRRFHEPQTLCITYERALERPG
jgi:hypothetical protein